MTIYSNQYFGENIEIKAYNRDSKLLYNNCKILSFMGNASLGTVDEVLQCRK
jgi:hypothetical protein